jgi:hypothetical protein
LNIALSVHIITNMKAPTNHKFCHTCMWIDVLFIQQDEK